VSLLGDLKGEFEGDSDLQLLLVILDVGIVADVGNAAETGNVGESSSTVAFLCSIASFAFFLASPERWGAGVETQKNVWGEIGGWGRVPFHENYAPSLSTIYDGA